MKQKRTLQTRTHILHYNHNCAMDLCIIFIQKITNSSRSINVYTIVFFTLQHGQEHSESLHSYKHIQPLHEYCTSVVDIHKDILKKGRTSENKHGHTLTLCMLKRHVECIILYNNIIISWRNITNLHCMNVKLI